MTFLDLIKLLTETGAFLLYAGFALCGLVFVYYYVPETKGLTLERIEQVFDDPQDTNDGRDDEIKLLTN